VRASGKNGTFLYSGHKSLLCAVSEPSLIGEWVPAVVVKPKSTNRTVCGQQKGRLPPGCRDLLCPADGRPEQSTILFSY